MTTFAEARSEARVGGDRMDRGRPEDQVAWQAVSTEKAADLQCFPFPISNFSAFWRVHFDSCLMT